MPGVSQSEETVTRPAGRNTLMQAGLVVLSLAYLAGLLYYASTRPIEADEGYYVSAARLVWEGKVPFRDFVYPQGFLLPYLYAWVWGIAPKSLIAMRYLSAVFGATAVFLWGRLLLSLKQLPTKVSLATLGVIVLNPYWVSWNVVVKTFASANLLMTICLICLYGALQRQTRWLYFASGLALGLCGCVRSLYAPLIPIAVLWLFQREWRTTKRSCAKTIAFTLGAVCGVVPMMIGYALDPAAFIFNNFRYRNLLAPHGDLIQILAGAKNSLISTMSHAALVFVLALAAIGLVSLLRLRRKKESGPYSEGDREYFQVSCLLLLVYVAISLIPFPIYDQYFTSPLIPFLVLFMAEGMRALFRYGAKAMIPTAIIAVALFYPGLKMEIDEYSPQPAVRLASFQKIADIIDENSSPNESVLSIWPGFTFESGREFFPGSENHFNYAVGYKITPEDREQYHVLSKTEVVQALSSRSVPVFVSGWSEFHLQSTMKREERDAYRAALDANYTLVGLVDHVEIYRVR